MSGHSHWSSIKHKKAAADAKRGKIFSKLSRLITVAAKNGGPDPDMNIKLRYAIDEARAANMPVDNIERAIKKATGDDGADNFEELTYEGYGPGGVAFLILTLTDNRNRTVPELRKIFEKHGGNLGQSGSVEWMFNTVGFFSVPKDKFDEDTITEAALESGADDIDSTDEFWEIYCNPGQFQDVKSSLEEAGITFDTAEVTKLPKNEVTVEPSVAKKIMNLHNDLDDHDDVQKVFMNMALTEHGP
ncbi:MAG: YebC/PmpR family DNA-binding transcriptional regulator [Planctomycetota bacterium]|nr:YebC/PmpR family DNA-binding transcriptional regulator [Planctomycetota bacterium]